MARSKSSRPSHHRVNRGTLKAEVREMDVIEGGCLCGTVRYQVSGAALATSNCPCKSGRRGGGARSVAWVVVGAADFAIVTGSPVSFRSSPPVVRTFCGKGGSPLTYKHDETP